MNQLLQPGKGLLILLTCLCVLQVKANQEEPKPTYESRNVYEKILASHNPLIPPSQNVSVSMETFLNWIQGLDARNQVLTSTTTVVLAWQDDSLKWNESEFSGINSISLPEGHVWTPNIYLWNKIGESGPAAFLGGGIVLIHSDGSCIWNIRMTHETACTVDVTYYPFDQQTCILSFGHSDQSLELLSKQNYMRLDRFSHSVMWTIIEVPAYVNNYYATETTPAQQDITYYVTIRRKTHLISEVYPFVVLAFMTLIPSTLAYKRHFWKIFIQMGILAGLFCTYIDTANKLPPTALVFPHVFKHLFVIVILNLIHLSLTCILSDLEYWNCLGSRAALVSSSISKRTMDIICKILCIFDMPHRNSSGVDDDAIELATENNRGDRGISSDISKERLLAIVHRIIFIILLLVVLFTTLDFLFDPPHVNEKVEEFKIIEMYTHRRDS